MSAPRTTHRAAQLLPWLAIAVAFSPTAFELASHLASERYDLYVLLAPLLLASLVARGAAGPVAPRRGAGGAVLALALLLELLGLATWSLTLARLGLALAVLGGALWTGLLRPSAAALSLGMVPLPTFLVTAGTPGLESAFGALAATLTGAVGVEVEAVGPLLFVAGDRLEIQPHETGARLALVLAELAWYAAHLEDRVSRARLARVPLWALLALPLQALGVVVGVLLLATLGGGVGAVWLNAGIWVTAAALGLGLVERRRGAAKPAELC